MPRENRQAHSVTITAALLAEHVGSRAIALAADERIIGASYRLSAERPAAYARQPQGGRLRTVALLGADMPPDSDDDPESEDEYATEAATVGIVSVEGPIEEISTRRDPCGAHTVGYDTIAESYTAAHADPKVDALLMRFRSPGGVVNGVFSCAARCEAAKAASGKTVVGIVDEDCESAAYLLAAALCDVIVIPVAGFAGSIGCRGGMYNASAKLAAKGITYTAWGWPAKADGDDVSGKLAGHPDLPPSALGNARGDAHVTDAGEMFGALVDRTRGSRGLTFAAVIALKAETLRGPAAVAAGLADMLGTREDALAIAMSHAAARHMANAQAVSMAARMTPPDPSPPPAPSPASAMSAAPPNPHDGDPRMSLARLAALAGLGADATAPTIEAALVPLLALSRAAMSAAGTNDPETARGKINAAISDAAEVPALRKAKSDLAARAEMSDRIVLLDAAVHTDKLTPAQAWDYGTEKDASGADKLGADGKAIVTRAPKARWLAPSLDAKGREVGCSLGNLAADLESRASGASGGKVTTTPFQPDEAKAPTSAGAGATQANASDRVLAETIGQPVEAITRSRNALFGADGVARV